MANPMANPMTNPMADEIVATRARLLAAGLSRDDERWLAGLGWRAGAVPPVTTQAEHDAYARRETILTKSIAHLTFAERGAAREGQLAAAIGARMADWRERDEEEE